MLTIEAYQKNQKKIAKVNALLAIANHYTIKNNELIENLEGVLDETWKHIFSHADNRDNPIFSSTLLRATTQTKKQLLELLPKAEQYNLTIANDNVKKGMFDILWRSRKELLDATISPTHTKVINKKIISPFNLEKTLLVKIKATAGKSDLCVINCLFNDGKEALLGFENITQNMIKEQITKELKIAMKKMISILKKDIKKNEKLVMHLRKELEPYIVLHKI